MPIPLQLRIQLERIELYSPNQCRVRFQSADIPRDDSRLAFDIRIGILLGGHSFRINAIVPRSRQFGFLDLQREQWRQQRELHGQQKLLYLLRIDPFQRLGLR